MPLLDAEYIKTGKIQYVAREFPLEAIHPLAFQAAQAALCAGDQGKYWEMHNRMFANQRALSPSDLVAHAQALGLELPAFQQCLDSGTKAAKVRRDLTDGRRAGITGTPTFLLAHVDGSESGAKVVAIIKGAVPFSSFKEAIDRALATLK